MNLPHLPEIVNGLPNLCGAEEYVEEVHAVIVEDGLQCRAVDEHGAAVPRVIDDGADDAQLGGAAHALNANRLAGADARPGRIGEPPRWCSFPPERLLKRSKNASRRCLSSGRIARIWIEPPSRRSSSVA